ncbi:unnamed protein product [Ilex paraguariensis]|uniref:Oligosaccharyl transferase subunit DAD1 n=1 Tax=Ilex paraguariensis TaxID=185542 RepID=A0ABC8RR64_9AQUA
MSRSSASKDAQALFRSLSSAYAITPSNLKIIDLYVMFAVFTALIQVICLYLQSLSLISLLIVDYDRELCIVPLVHIVY